MGKVIAAILATVVVCIFGGSPVRAQQAVWIQIEAQPSLATGQQAARDYAARLDAVNGFREGRWYAIVLGPFAPDDALAELSRLKAAGTIPGDSFITETEIYRQQWWPVGANALTADPVTLPDTAGSGDTEIAAVEEPAAPLPPPADETPAEARASERALDREARMALQVALEWEGFYDSGIDGAFGPGTRRAMSDYQAAKGFEPTGVLTSKQRADLLTGYQNAVASLGLASVRDDGAGIELTLPAGMVAFSHYEAPFAHYDPTGDSGVRVVLISQSGDQDTLYGLYDILQTLEIVPLDGPRERNRSDFTLEGTDDKISSYTYATLVDDAVKGFTLIWPKDRDVRLRDLAIREMRASFTSVEGEALADNAGLDDAEQDIDLLSGLDIRRPDKARTGFYVDAAGTVLTTSQAVENCTRITIDDLYEAGVVATDDNLGVALLKPVEALAPAGTARFLTGAPRLKTDVAVAGYAFEGRLSAPTLTYGTLADLKGLNGETGLTRLALVAQDGDAGGPVLDAGGAVVGMLLPRADTGGQRLPEDVNFAADAGALVTFLTDHGVAPEAMDGGDTLAPEDLSAAATDFTVLVSCWN